MNQYNVNSISVGSILGQITNEIIAIPEIQRSFVWDSTKVRDLIDSLYKGYPVGYIITWKNHDVKLKDGTSSMGKQILIDGQQRITALSTALLGQSVLDEIYKKKKITISFNLKTEEFQTKTPATEKSDEWITDIEDLKKNMEENCIPETFMNMSVGDYEEFLKQRQALMAKKLREYYFSL